MSAPAIGRLLGEGRMAQVFEYGEHVLKLYRGGEGKSAAFSEAACLGIVEAHGLPSPRAHAAGLYDGRWGLVMDRAPGEPLANLALSRPDLVAECLDEMVRLHRLMHEKPEARLPRLKTRLADRIGRATQLDAGVQERLLAALGALPDGGRLCHGDFHPFNIMGRPGATMIVDWPDATSGPPAADVCRSYLLMLQGAPELAEAYVERYVAAGGVSRDDVTAWLPVVAAARLAEGVVEEEARLLKMAKGVRPT